MYTSVWLNKKVRTIVRSFDSSISITNRQKKIDRKIFTYFIKYDRTLRRSNKYVYVFYTHTFKRQIFIIPVTFGNSGFTYAVGQLTLASMVSIFIECEKFNVNSSL